MESRGRHGRIGIDEIEGQIAVDTAAGKLEKSSLGRRAAYTTPRARDLERRVIEAVREGRGDVAPMVDANEVRLAIERSTLTEGQQKALDMIATSLRSPSSAWWAGRAPARAI